MAASSGSAIPFGMPSYTSFLPLPDLLETAFPGLPPSASTSSKSIPEVAKAALPAMSSHAHAAFLASPMPSGTAYAESTPVKEMSFVIRTPKRSGRVERISPVPVPKTLPRLTPGVTPARSSRSRISPSLTDGIAFLSSPHVPAEGNLTWADVEKSNEEVNATRRQRRLERIKPPGTSSNALLEVRHFNTARKVITWALRFKETTEDLEKDTDRTIQEHMKLGRPLSELLFTLLHVPSEAEEKDKKFADSALERAQMIENFEDSLASQEFNGDNFIVTVNKIPTPIHAWHLAKAMYLIAEANLLDFRTRWITYHKDDTIEVDATREEVDVTRDSEKAHFPLRIFVSCEKLGFGSFGEVFRSYDVQHRIFKAQKVAHVFEAALDALVKEFKKAKTLSPEMGYVPPPELFLRYHTSTLSRVSMIMPLMEGSLDKLARNPGVTSEMRMEIALKVWNCVYLSHKSGRYHPDLKPHNILYKLDAEKNFCAFLADVDRVQEKTEELEELIFPGTWQFHCMYLRGQIEEADLKDDVESFQIARERQFCYIAGASIFWILSGGYFPRECVDGRPIMAAPVRLDLLHAAGYPKEYVAFFGRMLSSDLSLRPSWEQCHAFFNSSL